MATILPKRQIRDEWNQPRKNGVRLCIWKDLPNCSRKKSIYKEIKKPSFYTSTEIFVASQRKEFGNEKFWKRHGMFRSDWSMTNTSGEKPGSNNDGNGYENVHLKSEFALLQT